MAKNELPEKIQKKIKEGWIRSWMMIEVLAITEKAAKDAMEKHIKKMKMEKKTIVYGRKNHSIEKIKNPRPDIPEAYSYVVELEVITETFEQLVVIAMTYGPSAVEILEPQKIEISIGEAQSIINSVAEMIHKFVQAGIGGIVIST